MSITTEDNRTEELVTDGVETEFDFSMLIHADTEVQVWYEVTDGNYTQLILDTHYTVVFTEDGGTITTIGGSSPYAAGKILIIRHLSITQLTNWLYNDNHTEQTHQDDFDRSVMRDLQIQEQLDRCVGFAIHSGTSNIEFPEPDANKFVAWNAAGDGLENKTAAEGGAVVTEFDDLSDVDVEAPAAGDIARWTGAVWAKYPDSNYLPTQTIGIADDNLLEVDGTPNSGEYARFTANGLEGRTLAEFVGDFSLEIGVDVQAWDAQLDSLANLTASEVTQLAQIDATTISSAQWGYLGAADQGLGTGDSPTLIGLTLSGLTAGSVLFAGVGGVISQDNDNLFWDDTSKTFKVSRLLAGGVQE